MHELIECYSSPAGVGGIIWPLCWRGNWGPGGDIMCSRSHRKYVPESEFKPKSLWLCRQLSLLSYSLIMHVVILMDYWYRENTWINIIKFFRYFSQQVSSSVSFPKYVTRVLYCLWQAEWGLVNTHLIFKNSILLGFWKVMWWLGIYQDFLVKKIKRSKYAKVPSAGSLRFGGCPGFF